MHNYCERFNTFTRDGFEIRAYWTPDLDATPHSLIEDEGPEYAEENQKRIDAWMRDEWRYVGIYCEAWKEGVLLDQSSGLWHIEDDSGIDYYNEVAEEEAAAAIALAKDALRRLGCISEPH